MNDAKKNEEKALLVSLDIKKAFDSISHNYMVKALEFFNFGPQFIKWVKLVSTNREACVILTKNNLGKNFKLERGNAQGDTISPYLFNICYQLLLIRFEFDLQIQALTPNEPAAVEPPPVPAPPPAPEPHRPATLPRVHLQETVSYNTKKVLAFADDCNIVCKASNENLIAVKNILAEFKTLSGLECNVEKSNFMVIGKTF
jgi:retron-type reverse transcriptase